MQTSTLLALGALGIGAAVVMSGGDADASDDDREDLDDDLKCTRVVLTQELLAQAVATLEGSGLTLSPDTSARLIFALLASVMPVEPPCVLGEDSLLVLPDGREVAWGEFSVEVDNMTVAELEALLGLDLLEEPKRPMPPIPTPDPPREGNELDDDAPAPAPPDGPRNLFDLATGDDVLSWQVSDAVEADGRVLARRRVVMLGYDSRWPFRGLALSKMRQLARANPGVSFVVVPFDLTRALAGVPDDNVAYIATAIDDEGRARAEVMLRRRNGAPQIPAKAWSDLVRYAKHGPNVTEPVLRAFEAADGRTYVAHVVGKQGEFAFVWRWKVYAQGEDSDQPLGTGTAAGREQAIDAARSFVRGLA